MNIDFLEIIDSENRLRFIQVCHITSIKASLENTHCFIFMTAPQETSSSRNYIRINKSIEHVIDRIMGRIVGRI